MATKPIPQIDFDKSVQRLLNLGLSRIAAENLVIQFWQISLNQNLSFKGLIDQATFDAAKLLFEKRRTIAEGLGPFYNAESCSDCHQNPVTGSASQVNVLRAGSFI